MFHTWFIFWFHEFFFFFLSKLQQDAPSPYEKYTRRQRHYSLSRTQSVRETSTDLGRPLRALSRQNSFSSLRRSESFYSGNAHASMTLGRSAYSGTDYASAVRRTSLFDGYAGFSLYSSIRYVFWRCILKSVFSEIPFKTWVQVVSR